MLLEGYQLYVAACAVLAVFFWMFGGYFAVGFSLLANMIILIRGTLVLEMFGLIRIKS